MFLVQTDEQAPLPESMTSVGVPFLHPRHPICLIFTPAIGVDLGPSSARTFTGRRPRLQLSDGARSHNHWNGLCRLGSECSIWRLSHAVGSGCFGRRQWEWKGGWRRSVRGGGLSEWYARFIIRHPLALLAFLLLVTDVTNDDPCIARGRKTDLDPH
jgi:hypothetical protein